MSPLNLGRGSVYEYTGTPSSSGSRGPRSQSQSSPRYNLGPHSQSPGNAKSPSSHGHNNMLEPSSGYGNNSGQPPVSYTSQNNSRINGPVDLEGNNPQDVVTEKSQSENTERLSFWKSRRGTITTAAIIFIIITAAIAGGVCGALLTRHK